MFFQACWHKRKTSLGPHPQQENYFVSLVYQISQTLMFHRFVYKIWEIYLFKHADLKLFFWAHPQRENYFVSWPTLVYHISQPLSFIDLFTKFERFAYIQACWLKKYFFEPTHNEKIILSRGQPWSIKYLNL